MAWHLMYEEQFFLIIFDKYMKFDGLSFAVSVRTIHMAWNPIYVEQFFPTDDLRLRWYLESLPV